MLAIVKGPGSRQAHRDGDDLRALPDGSGAVEVCDALKQSIATLPAQLRRSLTWDQGSEMSEHRRFAVESGVYGLRSTALGTGWEHARRQEWCSERLRSQTVPALLTPSGSF